MTRSLEGIPSPLYYASLTGLTESTTLLLEARADVNAQGGEYGNPLQAALHERHDIIVQALLEAGADINAPGNGEPLSLIAMAEGNPEVQATLRKHGAKA